MDTPLIITQLGTVIGAALDFVEVHYGFGRPSWYLTDHQLREFLKYTYGEWIQTFASLMWTKISICLFLMRIPVSKTYIRPLQAGVVILVVSNVILTLLWILQCSPVSAAWDLERKKHSRCFSRGQLLRIIMAQASKRRRLALGSVEADIKHSHFSRLRLHVRLIPCSDSKKAPDKPPH